MMKRSSGPHPDPPPHTREGRVAAAIWTTVPAALATEAGAIAMIWLGAVPALGVGLVALLLLQFTMAYRHPPASAVRRTMLITGPPVRYALLLLAGVLDVALRREPVLLALAGAIGLALAIPLLSAVLALPGRLKRP